MSARNGASSAGCSSDSDDLDHSCPRFMAIVRTPTSASTMASPRAGVTMVAARARD